MVDRFTVFMRICSECEDVLDVSVWPWCGERTTISHGLCPSCCEALEAALLLPPQKHPEPPTAY